MKAFFEETAKQIYKIFLSGSDINTPVVIMLFWTRPTPRVAHPSPLKKNRREGHLVVKNGIMLHELNSMGFTHGLDPSCVEHGGLASVEICMGISNHVLPLFSRTYTTSRAQ